MTDVTTQYENDAFTTITNGTLNPGDVSITVAAGEGALFPNVAAPQYFYATLEDAAGQVEIIQITTHTASGDTFTVARAQDNTSALTFVAGDFFEMRPNSAVFEELRDAILSKADITYVDSQDTAQTATFVDVAGDVMTGQLKGITPLAADDLTRKDYVDQYNFIDLAAAYPGAVLASVTVMDLLIVRDFTLPITLTDSLAKCGTGPSNAVSFTIKQDAVSVGSIDFATAATTATFTFTAGINFLVGEVLTIESPANTYSMADLRFTLTGVYDF